jgi:Na+-translocating ferredoxin:NAD+ oxidoreductase RnfG subunit
MPKRVIFSGVAVCVSLVAMSLMAYAFTLLTKEEALKEVFPSDFQVKPETKELTPEQVEKVKQRLGGNLEFYQEGSVSAHVEAETSIVFYLAEQNGVKKGVAIIDVEAGKWGPVEFMVAMDTEAQVRRVRVMSYQEIRGRPIAQASFMNQYRGKTSTSALEVGRDIVGISGATISSRAATFAVKKCIALYEVAYLHK